MPLWSTMVVRTWRLRGYGSGPVISSVSGNDVYCSCFRIFTLSCCAWSVLVRWRPSPWPAVVTQLVTQAALFSGQLPGGLSLSAQPLSVGGWPLLRDLLQSVSNLFLGAPGSFGMVPAYQSVGWTSLQRLNRWGL